MTRREDQKKERRNAIILAGLDLFVRRGYSATKITDIAKEVNMSVGLLFHYFESKEKLYEELIRIGLEGTRSFLDFNPEEPLTYFKEAASMIFEYLKDANVAKMFVLMGQASLNEAAPEVVKELVAQVNNVEYSVSIIEAGQKKGVIKQGDPYALSAAFWSSIQGIAEEVAVAPNMPIPEADWIIDIIKQH